MSSGSIYLSLGLIVGLGISLQWIARLLRIPGIVLLLPAGIVVGPVLGLVNPPAIFGASFFPLVTIGVGILLLRGGFELRLRNLQPRNRTAISRLVIIGVILTTAIGIGALLLLIGVSFQLAFVLAALLVVSGPTVVGPILSYARPREPVGSVLLWEGIILDPIGASLAVAAVSFITAENRNPFLDLVLTAAVGVGLGVAAALVFRLADRTRYIPKRFEILVALMLAIVVITVGELILSEAGLFAALAMGFVLANQRGTPVGGIETLTETIEPLVIGILFITLAALVDLSAMALYLLPALALVAIYVIIQRPLVSFLATQGLGYEQPDRIFIGAMHPRGIVAAATASLFALSLANAGVSFPQMVPMVFIVILSTVVIYGLGSPLLSRYLKIAEPEPTGVAIYGDQPWAWDLAGSLHEAGALVMLLAPGRDEVQRLADSGKIPYRVYTGSMDDLRDEDIVDDAHLFKNRIEWLIIASSNRDSLLLAYQAFIGLIGLANMIGFGTSRRLQDQIVFGGRVDVLKKTPFGLFGRKEDELLDMLRKGASFKAITSREQPKGGGTPEGMKPFLRVNKDGTLAVPGSDSRLAEGQSLIVITEPSHSSSEGGPQRQG